MAKVTSAIPEPIPSVRNSRSIAVETIEILITLELWGFFYD